MFLKFVVLLNTTIQDILAWHLFEFKNWCGTLTEIFSAAALQSRSRSMSRMGASSIPGRLCASGSGKLSGLRLTANPATMWRMRRNWKCRVWWQDSPAETGLFRTELRFLQSECETTSVGWGRREPGTVRFDSLCQWKWPYGIILQHTIVDSEIYCYFCKIRLGVL